MNAVNGVVTGVTYNNSATSSTASTYTLTTGVWYRFRVWTEVAGAKVWFEIYNGAGALVWQDSLTTNIPKTAGRETAAGIVTYQLAASGARDLIAMDFISYEYTRDLVR